MRLELQEEKSDPTVAVDAATVEETPHADGSAVTLRELVDEFKRETLSQGRRIALGVLACGALWLVCSLYAPLWLAPTRGGGDSVSLILPWVFLASFMLPCVLIWPTRRQRTVLAALAREADKSVVGELVVLYRGIQPRATQRALRERLIDLLPQLQASDAGALSRVQMAHLIHLLGHSADYRETNKGRSAELSLAILKALEQVGDRAAIPTVKRIAALQPRGRHRSHEERLRQAAQACLEALEVRAELGHDRLLRPAADPAAPAVLLRPAGAVADAPAELLLRPGDGP